MNRLLAMATGGAMIEPRWLIPAAVVVLAGAIVMSPVTLVTAVPLVALTIWASRGLTGVERRLVLTILVVAIAIRVVMIAGLFLSSDPSHLISFPFDGDGAWVKHRAFWMRNLWLGDTLHPRDLEDAITLYGWTSYIYVLGYVQFLLGPAPYAVHLVSLCCFTAAIVLLHRLVRAHFGPIAAFIALAIMAFLPSWITWSVSAMRESFYFLALTGFLYALAQAALDRSTVKRLIGLALAIGTVWLLTTIRTSGMLSITAGTAGIALAGTFVVRRPYLMVVALIALVPVTTYVLKQPAVQSAVLDEVYRAATTHRGNVMERGHGYELLDARFYITPEVTILPNKTRHTPAWAEYIRTITWPEAQRFLVRGLATSVLFPFPWQSVSAPEMAIIPQQMLWYVLLALAVLGAIRGSKTAVFVTWLFIGLIGMSLVAMAASEGNFGTLVRHRDTIVPFVACLSGLGVISLLSWTGAWTAQPRSVETPAPAAEDAGPWRTAVTRSALVSAMRTSAVVKGIVAFWAPVVGDRNDDYSIGQRMPIESLAFAASGSRVVRAINASLNFVMGLCSDSAIGGFVRDARRQLLAIEPWQRLRLGGSIVFASTMIAGLPGYLAGASWPPALVWTGTLLVSAAAMIGAEYVAAADFHHEGKDPRVAYR